MHRLALVLACAGTLSACSLNRQQRMGSAAAGLATSIVGSALVVDGDLARGTTIFAVGAALVGMAATAESPDEAPVGPFEISPPARLPADPPGLAASSVPRTDRVRRLANAARSAARRGNCRHVLAIADRIEELDPAYRHNGFARDPDLARCL